MGCEQSKQPARVSKGPASHHSPPPGQPQNLDQPEPAVSKSWEDFYDAAIAVFVEGHVVVRQGAYVSADAVFGAFMSFCDGGGGQDAGVFGKTRVANHAGRLHRTKVLCDIAQAAVAAIAVADDADPVTFVFDDCKNVAFVVNLELTSFPVPVGGPKNVFSVGSYFGCRMYNFFQKPFLPQA